MTNALTHEEADYYTEEIVKLSSKLSPDRPLDKDMIYKSIKNNGLEVFINTLFEAFSMTDAPQLLVLADKAIEMMEESEE